MKNSENKQVAPKRHKRRVPRLKLHFPVQIEVVTRDGNEQRIEARTVELSRYGATLESRERVSLEVAVNLTMPFGGPYLAQINGVWVESDEGQYLLSVKLLDPPEWTAPNTAISLAPSQENSVQMVLEPRTYYLLTSYQSYLLESKKQEQTVEQITHSLVKKAVRFDIHFQKWMTQKIMEDLQSWEAESVSSTTPA